MNIITIENKGGKIRLNEHVHRESIDRMIEEIGRLFGASAVASGADFGPIMACVENAVDTLDIEINSPGGSVFDGYVIFNEIKSLRDRGVVVTATITGMAASMASVICMACDKIRMASHGRMMIHDASNVTAGNAEAMRKMADLLDGISGDIAAIYAKRTGKTVTSIRTMMKAETWMNAKDAKSLGFIDEILTSGTSKNAVDIAAADNIPGDMKFLDRLTSPSDTEATERIAALELQVSNHDQTVADFQSRLETAENALQEAAGLAASNKLLTDTVAQHVATIGTHTATITAHEAKIVELTAAAEITPEKISARAAEMLAAQGHGEPLVINGNAGDKVSHLERFNALSGGEASAYFKDHEKDIAAEQKAARLSARK